MDADGSPSNRDLLLGGHRLNVDESTSPVQKFEDEYGDIAGAFVGIPHLANDVHGSASRWGVGQLRYLQGRYQAHVIGARQRRDRKSRGGSYFPSVTRTPPRDRYYYQQNPRRY